jgi:hypothetical protein
MLKRSNVTTISNQRKKMRILPSKSPAVTRNSTSFLFQYILNEANFSDRVRVRRVFPGRLGRFKVLVHLLHTGGVLIPTYDGNTLTSYYRMVL